MRLIPSMIVQCEIVKSLLSSEKSKEKVELPERYKIIVGCDAVLDRNKLLKGNFKLSLL